MISTLSLISEIDKLDKNRAYNYVSSSNNNKIKLVSVDKSGTPAITCKRVSDTGEERPCNISRDRIEKIAVELSNGLPVHVDTIFSGGGNDRSVLEGLLAHLPNVYVCKIDSKKHLLWREDITHERGVISTLSRDEIGDYLEKHKKYSRVGSPHNLIYFGAPGTGKSFQLNKSANDSFDPQNVDRVTFYPTYTYQQFVGAYKPCMISIEENEEKTQGTGRKKEISYEFIPGPFLRLLAKALVNPDSDYLLIIEELNRANASAVFGDVFQLLDRKNGKSEYPIAISEDMKSFLESQDDVSKKEIKLRDVTAGYSQLSLPSNFYIWATMNSADQGVFPIDTAFKRRWDFKYQDIDTDEEKIKKYEVTIKGETYRWNDIRKAINETLLAVTKVNGDKLLGPFFIRIETLEDNATLFEAFKSKVLMYLFEDAARHNTTSIFKGERSELTYSSICKRLENDGLKAVLNINVDKVPDTTTSKESTDASVQ